jgi:hypothetical protein
MVRAGKTSLTLQMADVKRMIEIPLDLDTSSLAPILAFGMECEAEDGR